MTPCWSCGPVSNLEVQHQVVQLEQVIEVQLQSDWIQLYMTNKQNNSSIRCTAC